MNEWRVVGNWLHGPNGERVRSIAGAQGGGGGGGMGGGGGGSVDLTFGQGGVWAEKTQRRMELLKALIANAHGTQVTTGGSPASAQYKTWDPNSIRRLMSFNSRGGA